MGLTMKTIISSILFMGLAGTAVAETGDIQAGAGLSTFGAMIEGSYEITPQIKARGFYLGGINVSETDTYESEDDTNYDVTADLSLGALGVVADYYVLGGWRVSGGLFFSNSSISTEFDDGTDTFEAEIAFKDDVALMLATGYNYTWNSGVYLSGELGAIFTSLEASTNATDADFQTDIDDLNDELANLPAVPYLSLTVGYTF